MKIAIFGGTGRTGIHVVRQALAEGYEVAALARTPAKMTVQDEKLTVIPGDVTDKTAVAQTIAGCDAVISAIAPNLAGVKNIIAAMKEEGVHRLIITSGAGVKRAGDDPPLSSKIISRLIKTFSKDVYEQSVGIADAVQASGLDYTLVRAPRLVDKPATAELYTGPLNKNMKTTLSREGYGRFLVAQVQQKEWIGQTPVLSDK